MRPSLRFLALAVIGWAGIRAATLGALPGAEMFKVERSEAKPPPPIVATQFPPIDPVDPMTDSTDWGLRGSGDPPTSTSWSGEDVFDVYTKGDGTALNGSNYRDW